MYKYLGDKKRPSKIIKFLNIIYTRQKKILN